jgi:hypothetical protein
MNCDTCGIEYRDDVPHPPAVCAEHAGAELKKAQKGLDGALETISKLKLERRGFQIMARKMMDGNDPGFWRAAMEDGKYERVGGNAPCSDCGVVYYEHPELPGFPTFHMICSGDIVKT